MTLKIPTIDLDARQSTLPPQAIVDQVAHAAEHFGFFQVINHGLPADHLDELWAVTRAFFDQDRATKHTIGRTFEQPRGYYDRELTKNKRDLKEVLDIGQVSFPALAEDHPDNIAEVDGPNRWPEMEGFRDAVMRHFAQSSALSRWLLSAFTLGLGENADFLDRHFSPHSTSFLRMNHYPVEDLFDEDERNDVAERGDMALHHHTDAGALTILLQDDVGGLQVRVDDVWVDVPPTDGAIVVNTGDMMQVWSNDRYQAAEHRVLPRTNTRRFSLPYFFNPTYDTNYAPLPGSIASGDVAHYRSINWGEFRQARADGDYADYGDEVQISHFRTPTNL